MPLRLLPSVRRRWRGEGSRWPARASVPGPRDDGDDEPPGWSACAVLAESAAPSSPWTRPGFVCQWGWNASRGWLTLPDCVAVRQDGAGRRTRPPSRNALSAVFQREGARFFFSVCYLPFRTVLCSFVELNGSDCFCFYLFIYLFIGVAASYCFGSDEGSRVAKTASSCPDQSGERKGMDQELESQVRSF